jgi:hypothetical protein
MAQKVLEGCRSMAVEKGWKEHIAIVDSGAI